MEVQRWRCWVYGLSRIPRDARFLDCRSYRLSMKNCKASTILSILVLPSPNLIIHGVAAEALSWQAPFGRLGDG
jgi:hypothetical protein